jgi:hypothetical protein
MGGSLMPSARIAGAPPPPPLLVRRAVKGLHELEMQRIRDRLVDFRTLGAPAADAPEGNGPPDLRSGLLAQLRAATTMQVCALRARGEPPERMLRAVKTMLCDALTLEGWMHPAAVEPLMRRVVRWSIEAYYDR